MFSLEKGERIVWSGKPKRKGCIGSYLFAIVMGYVLGESVSYLSGYRWPEYPVIITPVIMIIIIVFGFEMVIRPTRFFITNKRFIRGLTIPARRRVIAVPVDLVKDINFKQGELQRIVNYGNVIISTAGKPSRLTFEAVYNPVEVTKIASGVIKISKRARGSV